MYKVRLHRLKDECHDDLGLGFCLTPDKCKASGKEVELHDLTFEQRTECQDSTTILQHKDGSFEYKDAAHTRALWCKYGLNLSGSLEPLNEYSFPELQEMAIAIKERAEAGTNPIK